MQGPSMAAYGNKFMQYMDFFSLPRPGLAGWGPRIVIHTGEVQGSIPCAPTIHHPAYRGFFALHQDPLATFRDATKPGNIDAAGTAVTYRTRHMWREAVANVALGGGRIRATECRSREGGFGVRRAKTTSR